MPVSTATGRCFLRPFCLLDRINSARGDNSNTKNYNCSSSSSFFFLGDNFNIKNCSRPSSFSSSFSSSSLFNAFSHTWHLFYRHAFLCVLWLQLSAVSHWCSNSSEFATDNWDYSLSDFFSVTITAHIAYASTNKTKFVWIETGNCLPWAGGPHGCLLARFDATMMMKKKNIVA